MSNSNHRKARATVNKSEVRTFDQFRTEAGSAEPYPLDLGEGTVIEIPAPDTTDQIIRLSESGHKPREALQILCGEHYPQVYARLKDEHISVFNNLLADMSQHFGMGNAPSGHRGN